jgi:hypothetical protein
MAALTGAVSQFFIAKASKIFENLCFCWTSVRNAREDMRFEPERWPYRVSWHWSSERWGTDCFQNVYFAKSHEEIQAPHHEGVWSVSAPARTLWSADKFLTPATNRTLEVQSVGLSIVRIVKSWRWLRVTLDGVWIGDGIYRPLYHTARDYP